MILFLFCLASISNSANVIYANINGSLHENILQSFPYNSGRNAIFAAIERDIFEIQYGLYTGAYNYNLDPEVKGTTIESTNSEDSNIVSNRIINLNTADQGGVERLKTVKY